MNDKNIPFSPPDISQEEIDEVIDTLKSGWITTGPKTKQLEKDIAKYCETENATCLNSATAGLELVLRMFDIGEGDEVITTPYTFAATANVILHTGAKPVFADILDNEFNIDPKKIADVFTEKTKAVIPVDFAGYPVDYDEIKNVVNENKNKFKPKKGSLQEHFDRAIILADSAHSFGASYKNKMIGNVTDFAVFSFHAVKNLVTAEGGCITFNSFDNLSSEEIYKNLQLLSLHGQSKDALTKMKLGGWKYNIELAGYKCNMTDIQASIGLVQLKRYENELLPKRKRIFEIYNEQFKDDDRFIIPPFNSENKKTSYHLYPIRINGADEEKRNNIIQKMTDRKIAVNVHFIPVVMHSAYTKLGFSIKDFPYTYKAYQNEISLPIYSSLLEEDVYRVCESLKAIV